MLESQIEELLKRHPNLDRMMCETLLKMHEQGKLETTAPAGVTAQGAFNDIHEILGGKPVC